MTDKIAKLFKNSLWTELLIGSDQINSIILQAKDREDWSSLLFRVQKSVKTNEP